MYVHSQSNELVSYLHILHELSEEQVIHGHDDAVVAVACAVV
jgi:hypothetical protein